MNDAEYQASNSALLADAITAYEAGATGAGVKVAVIDTGINPNLPEFKGRLDPASQDVAANRGLVDHQGHGSMVSGVLAANRDGQYMQGVAYNATILSLNVYDPAGCKNGNDCFLDDRIDAAIDLATVNQAKIMSMSFGDEEGMTDAVWPAMQRAVDAGIVMVLAAGNSGTANPNGFALKNIENNGGSGLFIIAGSMDANRNISSFSDRAGTTEAAESYLVALGRNNATVNQFGTHVNVSGTSFATPTIAGAAALLASAFPNLTGPQIVDLLLSTADDAGAPGTDPVFGRGILNIASAFKPKGQTSIAGTGQPVSLFDNGSGSGPMGDAAASSTAKTIVLDQYSRAYTVDLAKTVGSAAPDRPLSESFGSTAVETVSLAAGPVSMRLTSQTDQPTTALLKKLWAHETDRQQAKRVALLAITQLSSRTKMALGLSQSTRALQRQLSNAADRAFLVARDPGSRGGVQTLPSTAIGVRYQIGAVGVSLTEERGKSWTGKRLADAHMPEYRIDALSLDAAAGPARLTLTASRQHESGTVLGARFADAIYGGGATSHFVDASLDVDLGSGWSTSASYRGGWTSLGAGLGLAQSGRMSSRSLAVDAVKQRPFGLLGTLSLGYSEPLRVTAGGLTLLAPSSWNYETGEARYGNLFLGLAPKGRERDVEVAYTRPAFGGFLGLHSFARLQPGNIRDSRPDAGAAIRFTLAR
ncbi:MAG TPA: S8 family peptidase [Sphingomicrobium sp.]